MDKVSWNMVILPVSAGFSPEHSRLSKTLLHVADQSASWHLQLLCDQGLLSGNATPKTLVDHL